MESDALKIQIITTTSDVLEVESLTALRGLSEDSVGERLIVSKFLIDVAHVGSVLSAPCVTHLFNCAIGTMQEFEKSYTKMVNRLPKDQKDIINGEHRQQKPAISKFYQRFVVVLILTLFFKLIYFLLGTSITSKPFFTRKFSTLLSFVS